MRKTIIAAALMAATAGALPVAAHADTRCVNPRTNATTGALVGAAGGAAIGSVLAGRGDRGKGAVLGALGGALLGGAVGNQQTRCPEGYYAYDDQTRQYYDNTGAVYNPGYAPPPPAAYGPPPPPPGAYDRGPGYAGGADYWRDAPQDIRSRLDWAQRRIDRSAERGRLSPREASNAQNDLLDIRRQYARLSRRGGGPEGLNPADRQYLNDRLNTLARNVRWDTQDRNRY